MKLVNHLVAAYVWSRLMRFLEMEFVKMRLKLMEISCMEGFM